MLTSQNKLHQWLLCEQISLVPMGVLAPGFGPPNFVGPQILFFCYWKTHAKYRNPTITTSWRKVCVREREGERKKNNSGHLIPLINLFIFLMYFQDFSIFDRFWGSLCLNIKMGPKNPMLHILSWPNFRKNTFKFVYGASSFWNLPTDLLYIYSTFSNTNPCLKQ